MKFPWFIWIPRILIIMLALFMALFSFDVFSEGYTFWNTVLAFLIHNVATILLLVTLFITWKRPLFGAIFFFVLTIVMTLFFRTYETVGTFLAFSIPPVIAAVLFLLAHFKRRID